MPSLLGNVKGSRLYDLKSYVFKKFKVKRERISLVLKSSLQFFSIFPPSAIKSIQTLKHFAYKKWRRIWTQTQRWTGAECLLAALSLIRQRKKTSQKSKQRKLDKPATRIKQLWLFPLFLLKCFICLKKLYPYLFGTDLCIFGAFYF